ncbi:MAG: ABC transporter ATP-binding protein [Armatimonadota bacterium]|nr:ABC transporter ATP-binding protein [Armatimonadota bacterium]MDR7471273.1 ABC transporter ATP-binding protein [Armatimonadota bacterium]
MPDVVLDSVTKEFPGGVVAVRDVTLRVPDGEFMCLLGPSGSGKSTLLRMIAGLEELTAGEIRIGRRIVDSARRGVYVPPELRGVGLVFQSYALWPHLTVRENVEFGLVVRKTPEAERRRRVAAVLDLLGILGVADRYPWQISGGQQQRVALARALAVEPEVLLLDEPLSNLDARLRVELRAELKRLHQRLGNTVLYVTHDQLEAMTLGTMVGVMRDGVVEEVGEPMRVYREPVNRFVAEFLGSPPINVVEVRAHRGTGLGTALLSYVEQTMGARVAAVVWAVGIRPEALRLGPAAGEEAWATSASVETVMPTGAMWIVGVRAMGEVLYASCLEEPRVGPCLCWVARDDFILFAQDGSRIPWQERVSAT